MLSRICGNDISLKDVILTDLQSEMSMLVNIFAFSIYKEWLLYSQNANWQVHDIISHIKVDMSARIKVYGSIRSMSSIVTLLNDVYKKL